MPIVCCVVPASGRISKSNISKEDLQKIKQMLKKNDVEKRTPEK